jgi:hypothetical protein
MRVLPLGGYDGILGMDWLEQQGLMTCNWEDKWISFDQQDHPVKLQGLQSSALTSIQALSVEQLVKSYKGNDVWAVAELCLVENQLQISAGVPEEIQLVLDDFAEVFQAPQGLPPHREFDHAVNLLPDTQPINCRPYRYSPLQKDEIEKQVKEMLLQGTMISSVSPFASPVLLVKKKDGSWRFCIDYRKLNAVTVKSKFPLPVVDELLDELAGTKIFSKLDLRAGYHQIRMVPTDEAKTAFKTHNGHYQFRVMPFGLTNAPATFQCIMNSVFAPFVRKFVLVFMDDILVYSKSLAEHVEHLKLVFQLLKDHQFFVKLSKCSFAQPKLEYLGHIISDQGVATDPEKTKVMLAWPVPASATELRGFLGLTGYYRKFVKGYGVLAKPLTVLLQKQAFVWTSEAQLAFDKLKQAMSCTPVLAMPDFTKPFCIETDACATGIGAVLMQTG